MKNKNRSIGLIILILSILAFTIINNKKLNKVEKAKQERKEKKERQNRLVLQKKEEYQKELNIQRLKERKEREERREIQKRQEKELQKKQIEKESLEYNKKLLEKQNKKSVKKYITETIVYKFNEQQKRSRNRSKNMRNVNKTYSVDCDFKPFNVGENSDNIFKIHRFLNLNGNTRVSKQGVNSPGNEGSYSSQKTIDAIKRFQKLCNLNITGIINNETKSLMRKLCYEEKITIKKLNINY